MRSVTASGRPRAATFGLLIGVPVALLVCFRAMDVDLGQFFRGFGPLGSFLVKFFVQPDFGYLPTLLGLTVETFFIAFVASVGAAAISLPLSLLAARNCNPNPWIRGIVKTIAAGARAIPDLLLALILVSALGIGKAPGIVALAVATIAYLVKAYAEVLEVVSQGPVEGIAAAGGSPFAQRICGVVPQAGPDLVGLSLYGLDSNLRSASILGAIGAGGIGYDLAAAIRHFRYDRLGEMILSIYLSVWLVDALSSWARRKLQ